MAIDRGYGIATSSVIADSYDLDSLIANTEAAKAAALVAQTAAELAETNAETAETNAETAQAAAETAQTAAELAETNAETAETSITGSEAACAASATAAALSETAAETAETNAETAETNAETAETNAETAETNAAASQTAAASSASSASTSASTATTKASEASTSATAAASSATSASSSATSAASSASTATTQASNASTSASTATTQASAASTSATAASSSASSASTAQTAAETAQTAAETAQTAAETVADNIDDVYLGAKASDPSVDNDGDALNSGDWYFNTSSNLSRIYDGSSFNDVATSTTAFLPKAGGTMTGNIAFGDNDKATFGASDDLQIYHDSSSGDSFITESGSGHLRMIVDDLRIRNSSDTAHLIKANDAGSVDLYHDGSKKLQTTSTGIDVTGNIIASDKLRIVNDTASKVEFGDSGNTSIGKIEYTHSGNYLYFKVNDAERLRIDSSGNVGIGVSDPDVKLEVSGSARFAQENHSWTFDDTVNNRLGIVKKSGNYPVIASATGIPIIFSTSDNGNLQSSVSSQTLTEHMRIDDDGNVGIGTSSPSYKLETKDGDISVVKLEAASGGNTVNGVRFRVNNSANTAQSATLGMVNAETVNSWGGTLTFSTKPANGTADESVTERMRIDSSGNVGIGRTSMSYPLEVSGDILCGDSGNTLRFGRSGQSDGARIQCNNSSDLLFSNNGGSERMRIDSSGNVGIGTNDPQQLLHIKANNPGGKIRLEMGQSGVANNDVTGEIQFYHNDSSGAGVNADIKGICTSSVGAGALTFGTGTTSTTERLRIAADGRIYHMGNTGTCEFYYHAYASGTSSFYVDVTWANDASIATYAKVEAAFCHYTTYAAALETWVVSRSTTAFVSNELFRKDTTPGGSWTVSRTSANNLRITKNAGTSVGSGPVWIKVTYKDNN